MVARGLAVCSSGRLLLRETRSKIDVFAGREPDHEAQFAQDGVVALLHHDTASRGDDRCAADCAAIADPGFKITKIFLAVFRENGGDRLPCVFTISASVSTKAEAQPPGNDAPDR
jgi:hypothetical protein